MPKDIQIEIVGGCEGDCLVMNDYRIAGPKPWGGGRTKKTFYTTEGDILAAYKFKELAKLKQQLAIAVEALNRGVSLACPYFPVKSCKTDMFSALKTIQKELGQALQKIKELDK